MNHRTTDIVCILIALSGCTRRAVLRVTITPPPVTADLRCTSLPDEHRKIEWLASFLPALVYRCTLPDDEAQLCYAAEDAGYSIGIRERIDDAATAKALEQALIRFPARHHDAIRIGIDAGRRQQHRLSTDTALGWDPLCNSAPRQPPAELNPIPVDSRQTSLRP